MKIKEIKISIDIFALINYWIKLRKRKIRTVNGHKFNLKPDKPDKRDIKYKTLRIISLPESTELKNIKRFDLRYDQETLGSCTANAFLHAYLFILTVTGKAVVSLSRIFQYGNTRDPRFSNDDSGGSIRNAFKAANKYGICLEELWPYIVSKFNIMPPPKCFEDALNHQSIRYEKITMAVKQSIMEALFYSNPVVCGIPVYESFESDEVARTGIVPMPNKCKEQLLGYHAICMLDYDKDGVWCLNSWGKYWGKGGTFHLPWDFVLKYASDIWVLYSVE